MSHYELEFMPEALVEWKNLDKTIKARFIKKLEERVVNPHVAKDRLTGKLHGLYKIKSGNHRLVYSVQDDVLVVCVISVNKREDSKVYKIAERRKP